MLIRPNLSASDNRRIQAMLRGNQNGDLAQMLLDGAPFLSELTHTAVPQRAAPGTTATFTRATTATFTDFEGVLRTAPAGCARFVGARFVRNLVTVSSEDFSSGWNPGANGTGSAPTITGGYAAGPTDGSMASRVQFNVGAGTADTDSSYIYQLPTCNKGLAYFWVKSNTGANQRITIRARASSTIDDYDATVTTEWQLIKAIQTGGTAIIGLILLGDWKSANTADILVSKAQLEDITGRADQTTPSEYVSVGVESAPYHGAGVDGVKYFDTDLDGNPLTTMLGYKSETAATNSCLQSNAFTTAPWAALATPTATQNAVGPNGQANYAWTLEDNDAGNYEGYQQSPVAWSAGASGCYSVLVGKKTSSPSYPCLLMYYNRASNLYHYVIVNEVAGTVAIGGSTNPPAYGCVSFNDDFWLVWVSGTQAGATVITSLDLYPAASVDGTTLSAAKTGSTVFADAQFESGTTAPSSRIATTTAAVPRNADILTYIGGDVPNLKTLMATFRRESGVSSAGWAVALSDGTISNYESISAASATQARFLGVTGGATQWDVIPSYTAGTTSKAAFSAATNDIKMAKDGVAQTQDTSATVPTVTQLNVGHVAGSFQLNGNVGPIYGWTRNQSQSELNAVTA